MVNSPDVHKFSIDHWVMRVHRPEGIGPYPVLLMLHGWTGDENSMWIFTSRLPKHALIVAPRGLYPTKGSGYSWHPELPKPWPWISDFEAAADKLFTVLSKVNFPDGDFSNLHLLGFSQGAALAYTMALVNPGRITSLVCLSGFLPDGASAWLQSDRVKGLPVFIAHGTKDEQVPIGRARMSVELIEKAGANVTYCEDTVGHKLSAKCFHSMEAFYQHIRC